MLIVIFMLVWLANTLKRFRDKKYPFRQARSTVLQYHKEFLAKTVQPNEYIELINQLLKRLTIYAQASPEAASLSGQKWLDYLDKISQSNSFTTGQGKALGDMRYHRVTNFALSDLHTLVLRLIRVLEKNA